MTDNTPLHERLQKNSAILEDSVTDNGIRLSATYTRELIDLLDEAARATEPEAPHVTMARLLTEAEFSEEEDTSSISELVNLAFEHATLIPGPASGKRLARAMVPEIRAWAGESAADNADLIERLETTAPKALGRIVSAAFGRKEDPPRFSIPHRETDDDAVVYNALKDARAALLAAKPDKPTVPAEIDLRRLLHISTYLRWRAREATSNEQASVLRGDATMLDKLLAAVQREPSPPRPIVPAEMIEQAEASIEVCETAATVASLGAAQAMKDLLSAVQPGEASPPPADPSIANRQALTATIADLTDQLDAAREDQQTLLQIVDIIGQVANGTKTFDDLCAMAAVVVFDDPVAPASPPPAGDQPQSSVSKTGSIPPGTFAEWQRTMIAAGALSGLLAAPTRADEHVMAEIVVKHTDATIAALNGGPDGE